MPWFWFAIPLSVKLSLDFAYLTDYIKKPEKGSPKQNQIYKRGSLEDVLTTSLDSVLKPNH